MKQSPKKFTEGNIVYFGNERTKHINPSQVKSTIRWYREATLIDICEVTVTDAKRRKLFEVYKEVVHW